MPRVRRRPGLCRRLSEIGMGKSSQKAVNAMNDLSNAVEQLTQMVADLQRRVGALESRQPAAPTQPVQIVQPMWPRPHSPVVSAASASTENESQVFSVLGKAMLGIAGAYLLRWLAESNAGLRLPVVVASIVYAFLWLVPAARSPVEAWFASVTWSVTAALILVPMLWELTLRFHILPSMVTAAILCAFAIAACTLAWKRHFTEIAWVTEAAASIAAVVLAIATRDLVPYCFALLIIAVAGELAAARHRTLRVRLLVAAVADLALFALIWIYSSPANSRADYPSVATALLLFFAPALLLIYAASATAQTLLMRRDISLFEVTQTLLAALLTVWSVLALWPGRGPVVVGAFCLIASAAGYAIVFTWFDHYHAEQNYHVYLTGSLALLLAGGFLCLHPGALAIGFGCASIVSVVLGTYASRRTLQFHALALMAAAAFSSGLLAFGLRAMASSFPPSPGWIVSLTTACAFVCYAAVSRPSEESWPAYSLRVPLAALAILSAAALLVWAIARLTSSAAVPTDEYLAVVRTLVSCAAGLALAWCGSRWQRKELVWLAWTALALVALKLLFEDLRHGHLGFTAVSFFVYAISILLVPRLLHSKGKAATGGPG